MRLLAAQTLIASVAACWQYHPRGIVAPIDNRYEFPALLNTLGLKNFAVEVGVFEGIYSKLFLEAWQGQRLYLVDPWVEQDSKEYVDRANANETENARRMQKTIDNVSPFGNRVTIIRDFSVNAASIFEDNSLDFVYIDANHAYEPVLEDISAWYPKVRPGGVLAGHDYVKDGHYTDGKFGVRGAALTFFAPKCIQIWNTMRGDEYSIPSWYVYKPFIEIPPSVYQQDGLKIDSASGRAIEPFKENPYTAYPADTSQAAAPAADDAQAAAAQAGQVEQTSGAAVTDASADIVNVEHTAEAVVTADGSVGNAQVPPSSAAAAAESVALPDLMLDDDSEVLTAHDD